MLKTVTDSFIFRCSAFLIVFLYGKFCHCNEFHYKNVIGCTDKINAFGKKFLFHFSEFPVREIFHPLSPSVLRCFFVLQEKKKFVQEFVICNFWSICLF